MAPASDMLCDVNRSENTVAAELVGSLSALGVDVVFGLPGVHNLPIWSALSTSDIKLVGVRHEQAAAYAADGYARRTGKLGVAIVTSGPGAANAVCATGEAMASSSPLLVIATDIPTSLRLPDIYRGVLHETRGQARMFAPVTKAARDLGADEAIADAVADAAELALEPNAGPVYLGIPTDRLGQPAGPVTPRAAATAARGRSAPEVATREAADLLAAAERPLIWVGGGAVRAGAGADIGTLACRLGAPVVTTYMARGVLGEHPCVAPGPVHDPEIGALWDEADVVLAVGTDFDGMMTQNWRMPAPQRLININIDPLEIDKNYTADMALVGDARDVVRTLLEHLPEVDRGAEVAARLAPVAHRIRDAVTQDEPQARAFLDIVERALPADGALVVDMCIPGYWLAGYHRAKGERRLAYPVGWGTLGFAFPASLGSAATGAGPTVCVTGDGGFLFACGELATAAQERLAVTVVLVDDHGYGMLRFDQRHAGDTPFGVDFAPIDFATLASAFGIPATTVDGFGSAFEDALVAGIASQAPNLVVVNASMKPPVTTSPRWYRAAAAAPQGPEAVESARSTR
jgi:thiamine pyrophosphate-dependent acetolactate synthase large subunit-like protein